MSDITVVTSQLHHNRHICFFFLCRSMNQDLATGELTCSGIFDPYQECANMSCAWMSKIILQNIFNRVLVNLIIYTLLIRTY